MRIRTLKQTVTFKAAPRQVYELLIDSKKHAKLTGYKASIIPKVGGRFSAYDGVSAECSLIWYLSRKLS